jgi:cellulose synthase/poly-beta-1,6-N-acetylglucosamine synthase-like glycosyltransferase
MPPLVIKELCPISTTLAPRRRSRLSPDPALPAPPSDQEKYCYLGRQHRWLLYAQASAFSLIAYSIARFATADLRLMLFLIPMSLYAVALFVSLLSSSRRKRTSLTSHLAKVAGYTPTVYPSVDVFLPCAGEPLDLLANTYRYVAQLHWPAALNVWVLDDSARPEVRHLAEAHGFRYRTRPDRGVLKKAGNLRFGYEQSDADFIAIFDADFAPRPEYLHELIPYFDEPGIGIVQSPQFFDTHGKMGWLQRSAGATQELFYRWIQPARDRSNAAICVGTCAVYRRAALVKSGGFAQIGHSEDVHTGVNLLRVGFRVHYVPVVVSKGVCPDTFGGFVNQQYRWCTGSMSLLTDSSFHEIKHITPRQKLCFWAGFLYYISTAVNAFVAPLPGLAMLWLLPQWVEPMNSIWLLGALALWLIVLPLLMKSRWRITVLRVQYLYSFAHALAILHVLLGRTREWVATGAANGRSTPLAVTIGRMMRGYVALTQCLIWIGLARGIAAYGIGHYWAMAAFGVVTSYIVLPLVFIRTGGAKPSGARAAARVSPAVPSRRRGAARAGRAPVHHNSEVLGSRR